MSSAPYASQGAKRNLEIRIKLSILNPEAREVQEVLRHVDDGLVSVGRIIKTTCNTVRSIVILHVVGTLELESRREGDAEVSPVCTVVVVFGFEVATPSSAFDGNTSSFSGS
ncbi:hypothetical protein [Acetomicrobium sp.]|uniref:hypothetical protein n=1 Tax=Acetomicrobium sp. TaxID=1872099 RepID=UPI002FC8408D